MGKLSLNWNDEKDRMKCLIAAAVGCLYLNQIDEEARIMVLTAVLDQYVENGLGEDMTVDELDEFITSTMVAKVPNLM